MKYDLPDMNILLKLPARGSITTRSAAFNLKGALMQAGTAIWAVLLAVAVAGCGGGSTGPEVCQVGVSTMQFPTGCPTQAGGQTGIASLKLSLTDAAGTAVTPPQVSPGQARSLKAVVKDSTGAVAPNVAVTFTTTDKTGVFIPASGTALTNLDGVAAVGLPAGTQAGGFTATAIATVAGSATQGTAGYEVTFPTLKLEDMKITPATLSAGGNASVSVTVKSGSTPYTPPLAVSFTSPCSVAGKASIGPPVLTQNGTANTSYSDKGCGVADVITASVKLGDATATIAGTITVLPAAVGSIKFVSADTTNIALKGTGGFGRQEFSTLKFEVSDTTGSRVPGTLVDFVFSDSGTAQTVGGLTLHPTFATSAADGTVTTLVTAGTIPTSVRVVATVRGSTPRLTTLSNILVVSTGVPDQRHFSLATQIGNCEGWDFDQTCSVLTATLGDHFGNPVPDGTAVNFSAEGGIIDASCVTGSLPPPGPTPTGETTNVKVGPGSGTCSVLLRSSRPRPNEELNGLTKGRVTVLAYALGEEDFFDGNGNNVYDSGDAFADKSPDIYRNDDEGGATPGNPNGTWNPGEPCVGPNTAMTCSTPGDGRYNGVLRAPQVTSPQNLYVWAQLVQTFSGSTAFASLEPGGGTCPAGGRTDRLLKVQDINRNLMPAGSEIYISYGPLFLDPPIATVKNVVPPIGVPVIVPAYNVPVNCQPGGKLYVKVVTPRKEQTVITLATD